MANYCKIKPDCGLHLFESAKKRFGYETAWNLWSLCNVASFMNRKSFKLDAEGFPDIDSLMADSAV